MRIMGRTLRVLDDLLEVALRRGVRSPVAWTALAAGLAWIAVGPGARTVDPVIGGSPELLFERPWVDRMPETADDHFKIYFFSKERLDRKHQVGLFVSGNVWKREIEFFGYRIEGKTMHFMFPYDKSQAKSDFEVHDKAKPREFDLTFVLETDPRHLGKKSLYFSRYDWGDGKQVKSFRDLLQFLPHGIPDRP